MNQLLTTCPVCGERLFVNRLTCRSCDTTIEGHFDIGRLGRLSAEQMVFVETFIRCEGKLNRMEPELGMSYPTARSRLTEVIRALGYEVHETPEPVSDEERKTILQRLSEGEISSEQAVELLKGK